MQTIRQDLPTKEWTIFSLKRAKRPKDFKREKVNHVKEEYVANCPFCKGNETLTPNEIFSIKKGKNWQVRVVPNKFPALQPKNLNMSTERHNKGPYIYMDGIGSHEVIIESPKHSDDLATLPFPQVENIIQTYVERFLELSKNDDYQLIAIFRNHGQKAGTSLEHPHSQLVATSFVPGYVRNKLHQSQDYFDEFGKCVYCEIIKYELKVKERIISENKDFISIAPYASLVPYHIIIFPKNHESCFTEDLKKNLSNLAQVLSTVLRKLYYFLNDPDYNYVVYNLPTHRSKEKYYHWHLEILPRLTTRAGFEIGSGVSINTMLPEQCAKLLRNFKI